MVDESKFEVKEISADTLSSVSLIQYQPNKLIYQSSSSQAGLAVFSEIYYPIGWQVTIDGSKSEMIRANYVLRALEIPAGEHTIEFNFKPNAYYIGNKVSMAFSILLLFLVIGAIGHPFIFRSPEN